MFVRTWWRRIPWDTVLGEVAGWSLILVGTALVAFAYAVFQVPFNIAAGGVSGLAIVAHRLLPGLTVGVLYATMNVPLLVLGFFQLGRWRFLLRTLISVGLFAGLTDLFGLYVPRLVDRFPLAEDVLLNTVYGAILGGVGGGLIYRAGATMGGTGILGRVIQRRTGVPLSQVYLWTDGAIVLLMGLVFGWEISLYALLALFLNGLASDYTLEGPSSVRTGTIITDRPEVLVPTLQRELGRGVSYWEIKGGYQGARHYLVFITVFRPQVQDLKRIVAEHDENAFMVIEDAHQALGAGFTPLRRARRRNSPRPSTQTGK